MLFFDPSISTCRFVCFGFLRGLLNS